MPIDTSTILRQCILELRTAYDEAVHEFGIGSQQADAISDAMTWMAAWLDAYVNAYTAQQLE